MYLIRTIILGVELGPVASTSSDLSLLETCPAPDQSPLLTTVHVQGKIKSKLNGSL